MTSSKIASELIFNRLSISQIAKKYSISKAEVVKAIYNFETLYPNSSHLPSLKHRLKVELTKDFLKSNSSSLDFAEEYGIKLGNFRKLIREVIDDPKIITSDVIADRLFIRITSDIGIVVKNVPRRIVKLIAYYYVCEKHFTTDALANIYGTRQVTISAILRRGIAENIVDDVTAEKIVVQVKRYHAYIDAYIVAFDERAKLKATQS